MTAVIETRKTPGKPREFRAACNIGHLYRGRWTTVSTTAGVDANEHNTTEHVMWRYYRLDGTLTSDPWPTDHPFQPGAIIRVQGGAKPAEAAWNEETKGWAIAKWTEIDDPATAERTAAEINRPPLTPTEYLGVSETEAD